MPHDTLDPCALPPDHADLLRPASRRPGLLVPERHCPQEPPLQTCAPIYPRPASPACPWPCMHSSPIRSPPPPSPVCMTTNRIKPSPATGTASRQSKRHRPGSRNRSHHLSCRVGTSSPTEQNAAARRRPLSPFQEVPVRALHVPRSARAVAALPSALGEIPMPRAFRFATSGRFP